MTEDMILSTLKQADGQLTVKEIAEATQLGETTVRTHLKNLVEGGKVFKTGSKYSTTAAEPKPPRVKKEKPVREGPTQRDVAAELDTAVLEALKANGPQSCEALVGLVPITTTRARVYTSLWRLKRDEKVVKVQSESRTPQYELVK